MTMLQKLGPWLMCVALVFGVSRPSRGADPASCERTAIFPANPKHNHASCVVETKDGSLLAAWYAGSGERKADDVVIEGAWLAQGENGVGAASS